MAGVLWSKVAQSFTSGCKKTFSLHSISRAHAAGIPGPYCLLLGSGIGDIAAAQRCKLQGPLRSLTFRPFIAQLRNQNASNVELLRAMRLEHEAYGRLCMVFATQVCSAPLTMPHLLLVPLISPCILLAVFHADSCTL